MTKVSLILLSTPKGEPILPEITDKLADKLKYNRLLDFKYFPAVDKKYTLPIYQDSLEANRKQVHENIKKFNLSKYSCFSSFTECSYISAKKLFEMNHQLYDEFSPGTKFAGMDDLTTRRLIFNLVEDVSKLNCTNANITLLETIKTHNFDFWPIGDPLLNDIYNPVTAEQGRINTAKNLIEAIVDKEYREGCIIISDIDMAHQPYIIPKLTKQIPELIKQHYHPINLKIKPICVYTKESEEDANLNHLFYNSQLFSHAQRSEIAIENTLIDRANIDEFCKQTLYEVLGDSSKYL